MLHAYYALGTAVSKQVRAIRWIDIDKGQLDKPEQYNSIIVPGVLIGQVDVPWEQLAGNNQVGDGLFTVKTIFRLPAQTSLTDPTFSKNLSALQLADEVGDAILGVPGVTRRTRTRQYAVDTFYVVEETYLGRFTSGPSYTEKQVTVDINPTLFKPNQP
ncbi:hypothetical protein [Spirosoma aerolatum]|uniref:hypothetical protein n=1 Tax=Spirosoma aerolatum TaxID=1211326 RepID=UPI0009ACD467|nr:hypothetical protein [Spirosoma aerolatum]